MIDIGKVELDELVPPEAFEAATEKVREETGEQGGGRLQRAVAGLAASRIGAAMAAKFRQLDLLPLFVRDWGKSPEVAEAAKDSEDSPEPKFVRLGKLEQNLDLYPILSVSGFGLSASPIQFTLTLQAEFEAVEVGLSKGNVVEIGGGFCRLSALLKFGQFSFPAGMAPKEWQLGNGRKFEKPGVPLLGGTKKEA